MGFFEWLQDTGNLGVIANGCPLAHYLSFKFWELLPLRFGSNTVCQADLHETCSRGNMAVLKWLRNSMGETVS